MHLRETLQYFHASTMPSLIARCVITRSKTSGGESRRPMVEVELVGWWFGRRERLTVERGMALGALWATRWGGVKAKHALPILVVQATMPR